MAKQLEDKRGKRIDEYSPIDVLGKTPVYRQAERVLAVDIVLEHHGIAYIALQVGQGADQ